MLTKADDYPIHQAPVPIAYATTDRNFYDRYFFNGYPQDAAEVNGDGHFACAFGVYPGHNIMDAAFSVIVDGVQKNVHASKVMHMERMDTQVGPIRVEIVEPLQVLRIIVEDNEHGISASLTFTGRTQALEEPRFISRVGPRTVLDYTRLTQNGEWEGWIEVQGKRIEVTSPRYRGTRDRSWGIRPVGAADSQPVAPPPEPQFYWLWCPLNFDDRISLYHINSDRQGHAWNTNGVVCPVGGEPVEYARCSSDVTFKPGTRHAAAATLTLNGEDGDTTITLEPHYTFYMQGLGYVGSDWGHGHYKGENALGYDEIVLADAPALSFEHLHIQAFSTATMTTPDGKVHKGQGVFEQLIIGAHDPSGFAVMLDGAK
ncbi:MAG: hypothetical protein AAFY01_00560 [Pseudomonadota bacterium]